MRGLIWNINKNKVTATQLRSKQWLVGIQFVITIITRNSFSKKKKKGNVIRYNYMITFWNIKVGLKINCHQTSHRWELLMGQMLKGCFVLHEQIATYKQKEIIKIKLLGSNVASWTRSDQLFHAISTFTSICQAMLDCTIELKAGVTFSD